MRITIETATEETVSVSHGSKAEAVEPLEAVDGGAPAAELLEALSAEPVEEAVEPGEEVVEPGDAGAAPSWLVDVIESQKTLGTEGSTDS